MAHALHGHGTGLGSAANMRTGPRGPIWPILCHRRPANDLARAARMSACAAPDGADFGVQEPI